MLLARHSCLLIQPFPPSSLPSTYLAVWHVHASAVLDLPRVERLANDAMPVPHVARHFKDNVPVVDQNGVAFLSGAVEGLRGGREGGRDGE